MTDEQWLWLFVNESIDYDEKLERMCDKCKSDVISNRCIKCGKPLGNRNEQQFINPNFDTERFEHLSNGTNINSDDDIDHELIDQIMSKPQT